MKKNVSKVPTKTKMSLYNFPTLRLDVSSLFHLKYILFTLTIECGSYFNISINRRIYFIVVSTGLHFNL